MNNVKPLAYRLRPVTIDEIIGQKHLVSQGKIIHRMVSARRLTSMILYGAPGIGKTSIANAIAGTTSMSFRILNAVTSNKKDLEIIANEAISCNGLILMLDEVHRLDKPKQDFLLPYLESGQIILIGATTSNPYHAINPALRSRCQIFELKALTVDETVEVLERAIKKGFDDLQIEISPDALQQIALFAGGDVRSALNGLELAVLSTPPNKIGSVVIDKEIVAESMQQKNLVHDKDGDSHYDVLSALQKSIRGSDVNAAMHYMGRLIEAGDLQSLVRRLLVIAYEDVGLANPFAGERMLAAICAAERLGLPEARIPLAVAVVECCLSPKSNSAYCALDLALSDIRSGEYGEIPLHLKDASYFGAKKLGRGIGYKYPHDYPTAWVKQQYLPDKLKNKKYYSPKLTSKFEKRLAQIYEQLQK